MMLMVSIEGFPSFGTNLSASNLDMVTIIVMSVLVSVSIIIVSKI